MKKKSLVITAVFLSCTLVMPVAASPSGDEVQKTVVSIEDLDSIYEEDQIDVLADNQIESLDILEEEDNFVSSGEEFESIISKDIQQPIEIKDSDTNLSMSISLENVDDIESVELVGEAVVYKSENLNTGIETFEGGIRQSFILKNSEAQTKYDVKYTASGLSYINYAYDENGDTDGSLILYSEDGEMISAIDPAWAKDAKGNDVPTHYEINGVVVTQVIEPQKDNEYPIVADPTYYSSFFKSSKWVTRGTGKYKLSLSIVPKTLTRLSVAQAMVGWGHLRTKHSSSKNWKNTTGLYQQYKCHAQLAKTKSEWNIEPARPNVGQSKTNSAKCNPKH